MQTSYFTDLGYIGIGGGHGLMEQSSPKSLNDGALIDHRGHRGNG